MSGHEPISVTEVLSYLQLMGIASVELRAKYLRLIQRMDDTFFSHLAEKTPAQTQQT